MCKRTGRSTLHLNKLFSINGISRNCCWIKPPNKTRAEILPIVFHCWIALFSHQCHLFPKEVNNVHHDRECTCWRYSKKNKQTIKRKNTVKPAINVFTEIAVSGYLLQRSLAGFPKFKKKKNRKPQNLH